MFTLDRDARNNVWGVKKDGQPWLSFAKDDEKVLAELIARLNSGEALAQEQDQKKRLEAHGINYE